MTDGIEIRGGAGEFEAAVIAVVLDRIAAEERLAREGRPRSESQLPAWIRAIHPEEPELPLAPSGPADGHPRRRSVASSGDRRR